MEYITVTSRVNSPQLSESENAFRFIKHVQTYTKSKYPDVDKDGNKSFESGRADELLPAFELVYIPFDKRTKPKTKTVQFLSILCYAQSTLTSKCIFRDGKWGDNCC